MAANTTRSHVLLTPSDVVDKVAAAEGFSTFTDAQGQFERTQAYETGLIFDGTNTCYVTAPVGFVFPDDDYRIEIDIEIAPTRSLTACTISSDITWNGSDINGVTLAAIIFAVGTDTNYIQMRCCGVSKTFRVTAPENDPPERVYGRQQMTMGIWGGLARAGTVNGMATGTPVGTPPFGAGQSLTISTRGLASTSYLQTGDILYSWRLYEHSTNTLLTEAPIPQLIALSTGGTYTDANGFVWTLNRGDFPPNGQEMVVVSDADASVESLARQGTTTTLQSTSAVDVTGRSARRGVMAALASSAALTVTGRSLRKGTAATLASTATVTETGVTKRQGTTSTLASTGSLTLTGHMPMANPGGAMAALLAIGDLTVTGVRRSQGTASLASTGTLATSGQRHAQGTADLGATSALALSGGRRGSGTLGVLAAMGDLLTTGVSRRKAPLPVLGSASAIAFAGYTARKGTLASLGATSSISITSAKTTNHVAVIQGSGLDASKTTMRVHLTPSGVWQTLVLLDEVKGTQLRYLLPAGAYDQAELIVDGVGTIQVYPSISRKRYALVGTT